MLPTQDKHNLLHVKTQVQSGVKKTWETLEMGSTESRVKLGIDISRARVKQVLNTCICLLGSYKNDMISFLKHHHGFRLNLVGGLLKSHTYNTFYYNKYVLICNYRQAMFLDVIMSNIFPYASSKDKSCKNGLYTYLETECILFMVIYLFNASVQTHLIYYE